MRLSVSIVPSQVLTAKKLNRKFDLSIKTYFSLKMVVVHSLLTYEKPKQQKNGKCKQKKQSSGAVPLKQHSEEIQK